jgi:hypothetical protein
MFEETSIMTSLKKIEYRIRFVQGHCVPPISRLDDIMC